MNVGIILRYQSYGVIYLASSIVLLSFANILPLFLHMDHASMHRKGFIEYGISEVRKTSLPQRVDAALGESKID